MQTIGEGAAAICSTWRRGLGRSGMEGSSGSMIDVGSGGGCWSAGGSESNWWKCRARCRLSERSAPFFVLPSASLRARYSLVAWSCCARVTAMMCSAWLSCRSPPRLSRCWVRLPEEHGIGAVPVCSAKAASEWNRSLPAVWPIRIAAVSAPQPYSASSRGRCAVTSSASSAASRSIPRFRPRRSEICSRAILTRRRRGAFAAADRPGQASAVG